MLSSDKSRTGTITLTRAQSAASKLISATFAK